jgi:hypothetical protein
MILPVNSAIEKSRRSIGILKKKLFVSILGIGSDWQFMKPFKESSHGRMEMEMENEEGSRMLRCPRTAGSLQSSL